MPRKLSFDERKFVLKTYWKYENAQEVIRIWNNTFDTDPPSRLTIYQLRDKFEESGTLADAPRSGRPSVNNDDNRNLVAQSVVQSPKKSTRRRSLELDISRSTLQRILHSLNLKPYKPRLIHGLLEDDPDRRIQFCGIFINQCQETPDLLDQIVWTDEANFKLSGMVNKHNCVYWDTTNPHETYEMQLNQPGLTVWAGISSSGVIGPEFFEGTVNCDNYLELLQDTVVPALSRRHDFHNLYFMHDGAPPHYATKVRRHLDVTFPGKWIGRRGPIEYPARSPDLTPMDFSVWGIVKNSVYSKKPRTLAHMEQFIREAFQDFNAELCTKICRSVLSRSHECVSNEGKQFEHLR